MEQFDSIIKALCPQGVPYMELGKLGKFFGGLTGKSKADFEDGNSKFITYKNVYTNPSLKLDVEDKVRIIPGEKQRILEYGDVIFTGSSETQEECGISSVLTEKTDEKLYLNSFCFIYRFNDANIMLPDFSKHLFRSGDLRRQIIKTASGVTRYNVSKKLMEKVIVPVPPVEIQEKIIDILDDMLELETDFESALTQEIELRRKQQELTKKKLLDFSDRDDVKVMKLGEVCTVQAGGTPSKSKPEYWENGTIKWLSSTVCKNRKTVDDVTDYITKLGLEKSSAKMMKPGTTLIALVGATIGKLGFLEFEAAINQNVAGAYPNDLDVIIPQYVYYACSTLYNQFLNINNGKLAMANMSFVRGLEIPVPPVEEQQEICILLETMEKENEELITQISKELELSALRYRNIVDKMFSFERKEAY